MVISNNCVEIVKEFEGFSTTPYRDIVGVLTLGYGMTGNEIKGIKSVTKEQASSMLTRLLNNNYALPISIDLDKHGVKLKQNEFDALVSMAYNIGVGGILSSTLYKNVIKGIRDKNTIVSNFLMWNKAGGKVVPGLTRRRGLEAELFFKESKPTKPVYQEKYVKLFQTFYNGATQTTPQLVVDGDYGNLSQEAYKTLGKLLGGTY